MVVAGESTEAGINLATKRLEQSAALRNVQEGRLYALSFSLGCATSDVDSPKTLDDLLDRADTAMYRENASLN